VAYNRNFTTFSDDGKPLTLKSGDVLSFVWTMKDETPEIDPVDTFKALVKFLDDHDKLHVATPDNPPPKKLPLSRDAAFIAPTMQQAHHYARALNYNPRMVTLATYKSYLTKFAAVVPDEDFIVHVCGSWWDEDASDDAKDDLAEVIEYLEHRGFEIEKVNRIGEG
jgi:hypothetical protein